MMKSNEDEATNSSSRNSLDSISFINSTTIYESKGIF